MADGDMTGVLWSSSFSSSYRRYVELLNFPIVLQLSLGGGQLSGQPGAVLLLLHVQQVKGGELGVEVVPISVQLIHLHHQLLAGLPQQQVLLNQQTLRLADGAQGMSKAFLHIFFLPR
ncbi:hypothetical protein TYRP_009879 [Tyrophagus putrescentiae]|nr:hypothetical protein TYRP_009879 [Tyrophagus putrescentiae]